MALTEEQQAANEYQTELENNRRQHELTLNLRMVRLESIRLAKESLLENSKYKPVDERDVNSEDIIQYANNIINFIVT